MIDRRGVIELFKLTIYESHLVLNISQIPLLPTNARLLIIQELKTYQTLFLARFTCPPATMTRPLQVGILVGK